MTTTTSLCSGLATSRSGYSIYWARDERERVWWCFNAYRITCIHFLDIRVDYIHSHLLPSIKTRDISVGIQHHLTKCAGSAAGATEPRSCLACDSLRASRCGADLVRCLIRRTGNAAAFDATVKTSPFELCRVDAAPRYVCLLEAVRDLIYIQETMLTPSLWVIVETDMQIASVRSEPFASCISLGWKRQPAFVKRMNPFASSSPQTPPTSIPVLGRDLFRPSSRTQAWQMACEDR